MKDYIKALVNYGLEHELIQQADSRYVYNRLLDVMRLERGGGTAPKGEPLTAILTALTDDAVRRGLIGDSVTERDLFDTRLMGELTPFPHEVHDRFVREYAVSPERGTDWFYNFCGDVNYIRRDRLARDIRWVYKSEYGPMNITINLSKPEKDPRAIAAARRARQNGYPKCQLCAENEGYAGRLDHPARQNLRMVPVLLDGKFWYMQFSPYSYYDQHCIFLNQKHTPMYIGRDTFDKLLSLVTMLPHYFVGSNADLPIVGGSILSHEHFQGGLDVFPMTKARIEGMTFFDGFPDVKVGVVKWPMPVLRLNCASADRIVDLAERITCVWRDYNDEAAGIISETDGVPHNTVTPIARRDGVRYELDLVLRNNRTTEEYPLGVFHPHPELHHIKKENIGLIEVMGLAVLPPRLRTELETLKNAILSGSDIRADASIAAHADWAEELMRKHEFTAENADEILRQEVGAVFVRVLEDAAVFKRTPDGRAALQRFITSVNRIVSF